MTTTATTRNGIKDLWNAFMVKNAIFSSHDIPLCKTSTTSPPKKLIGYDEAKSIHKKNLASGNKNYHIHAFIHFYIDDQKFDGPKSSIWLYPKQALSIIRHFDGIIAPDFSTYADFPEPLKLWNFYRMNAFGFWISTLNIPVISNARWGTSETWNYCFDGNLQSNIIAIGTVASRAHTLDNKSLFEEGFKKMVEAVKPSIVIIYGSANYNCIKDAENLGITIISFPSKTSRIFEGRKHHE